MPPSLTSLLKSQGFTISILAALFLAWLAPDLGSDSGPLNPEFTRKVAVAFIFLIQGLSIPSKELARGLAQVKIHLFCLASNFLLTPAIMLGLLASSGKLIPEPMHPSLLYLAFVPTTISSAIVFTSNSNGNASTALFSATLSNTLGVFITPILCLSFIQLTGNELPSLTPLVIKLTLLVIVPMCVGQALRQFLKHDFNQYAPHFKRLANASVLFIVYTAFCNSVAAESWSEMGFRTAILLIAIVSIYLTINSSVIWYASRIVSKDTPNRIAAFFCGSQKTLAAGAPMAAIIFSTSSAETVGILILPLIAYHALQLFLAGALVPVFQKNSSQPE